MLPTIGPLIQYAIEHQSKLVPCKYYIVLEWYSWFKCLTMTKRKTNRQTDRQTDRQLDRQTNKRTLELVSIHNSSVASRICQEGQSERTCPSFPLFSECPSFSSFSWFSFSFSQILANFWLSRGALCSPWPQWLRHWFIGKLTSGWPLRDLWHLN